MASLENASPRPNDSVIEIRITDVVEEHHSKEANELPKINTSQGWEGDHQFNSPPDPRKELHDIFKNKALQGAKDRPLIQRVPTYLRDNEKSKGCYDPKLVSIGPYHHGNPKLKIGQNLKTRLVNQFSAYIEGKSSECNSLESYFHSGNFDEVARKARNCYDWDPTLDRLDEEAFKCLMFFDGCFVLYFIHYMYHKANLNNPEMNLQAGVVFRDLSLLENQIPYIVLQALGNDLLDGRHSIQTLAEAFSSFEGSKGRHTPLGNVVRGCYTTVKRSIEQLTNAMGIWKDASSSPAPDNSKKKEPLHLLDLFRTQLSGSELSSSNNTIKSSSDGLPNYWSSLHSVYELKSAGIKCATSGSSIISQVKFQPYFFNMFARLSLPAIVIGYNSKPIWLNLLAYEACPDFANDFAISSYIWFMSSLTSFPEDATELRKQGVLLNLLGSDQQAAELFSDLASHAALNPLKYFEVKQRIEKHFNDSFAVWTAELRYTYFKSPWAGIAFIAAIFVVFLTCAQTYYTVFPKK